MKAVIAIPAVKDFYATPHRHSALGARTVEALIKSYGWETRLLNFPAEAGRGRRLPLPPELAYLERHLIPDETGPLSFFRRFQRFGPAPEDAAHQILQESPDHIFLSCFAFAYAAEARDLGAALKRQAPQIPLSIGGAGVAALPGYFHNLGCFDHVLPGPAEKEIPALMGAPSPLNRHGPAAPFAIVPFSAPFRRKAARDYALILTRGCPRRCKFCSNHLGHGRDFQKTPPALLDEACRELKKGAGLTPGERIGFNLEDDNILCEPDYLLEVLEILRFHFPAARFRAENGLDYQFLSESLTEELIQRGFDKFNLSLGSALPNAMTAEGRPLALERYESVLACLSAHRVPSTTYFIAGLPSDNGGETVATLLYLHGQPTETGISLFYTVPGLPYFTSRDIHYQLHPRLCAGSSAYPWALKINAGKRPSTGGMKTGDLITAFRLSRLSNFLKRPPQNGREKELLDTLLKKRRLLTLRGKNRSIAEVPRQNLDMVQRFTSKAKEYR